MGPCTPGAIGPLQLEVIWYKIETLESKRMCQTPKQNAIICKNSVIFLCLHFPVESCHILLLSNILDFIPCDLEPVAKGMLF